MATKLTQKEKITNVDTLEHIIKVQSYINLFLTELLKRGQNHDRTKLDHPEVELFAEMTPKLATCSYKNEDGSISEEYKAMLEELKPALDHHYAKNRHHPEHYPDGVAGMTLIDLVEMICDWKASAHRQHNGNILQTLETNAKKHNIPETLVQILKNTVNHFDLNH